MPDPQEWALRFPGDLGRGDHLNLVEWLGLFRREVLRAAAERAVEAIQKVSEQHDAEEKAACCCDFWQAEISHLFDQIAEEP